MNSDGRLDNFDIAAFELALTHLGAYQVQYPGLTDYVARGDMNHDGHFDNFDIPGFSGALTGDNAAIGVPEPSGFVLAALGIATLVGAAVRCGYAR